jgi:hypothetical protein
MKNYKVYKHTFPNGKVYIGITSYKYVSIRWKNGTGYISQPFMWNAINKYGWENIRHEVLFDNLTKEEAEQKEIELIAFYKSNQKSFGYNIQSGGYANGELSEEARKAMSERMIGDKNPMKNNEVKKRVAEKLKGRKLSKERCKQLSENNPRKRKIICISTGEVFDSITLASKKYNIDTSSIINTCNGKRYSAGGYRFCYIENYAIDKDRTNKNYKKVKCVENNKIFNSVYDASIYCIGKKTANISNCLNGRSFTAYGKHWVYADV